ncbi:MAG: hypothetical protein EPO68_06050 [Planctomycetota bacterium]|nr:MAG: hypothetical protein EPO68_06050 [Planctomycetota bacterium]
MFHPHSSRPARAKTRRGRSALPLLVVVLAVAIGALYWLSRGTNAPPPNDALRAPAPSAEAAGATPAGEALAAEPARDDRALPAGAAPNAAPLARFDGRGRIRGSVDTPAGSELPAQYTVVVAPSRTLIGHEHAAERRVDVAGASEFEVPDLPLGGYDVHCEAPGMNGRALAVLLEKGSADPYVMLLLSPAGRLDGELVDAELFPLEDLVITLEPLGQLAGRRTTRTDARGRYAFDAVLDGEYRLHFGTAESPIAPARELAFQAPSFSFPRIVIADLHTVLVRVVDSRLQPVQGARIFGTGSKGGSFDGTTDALGEFRARHLPSGRLRLRAESEGFGKGFLALDLGPLPQRELVLELEP